MSRKTLDKLLKNFGLTEKETDVYVYLAKRGTKKTNDIAKALKANKGLVYRVPKKFGAKRTR